jgi:arylformamidase
MSATQAEAHHILLEHDCLIIENLALASITAGEYEMVCLPLKLVGLEGAPARVVLKMKE